MATRSLSGITKDNSPTYKAYQSGTHRLAAPEQTLKRLIPLMKSMGITRVANVTRLDTLGIPVVMVCRPNSRSLAVSQGKGMTTEAAKASGLMESIELYHAENILLPMKLASYRMLLNGDHTVVDVNHLPRLSASPYHDDLTMLWCEGQDLIQDRMIWAPYEMVHMNYTSPFPPGSGCFAMGSNGLASGNHLLEAIVHGICEVIERDAVALWQVTGASRLEDACLNLNQITDPLCVEVIEKFQNANANIDVMVWDITSDLAVPTFQCVIVEYNIDGLQIRHAESGYGCHPSRQVALLRALTEAAQSRLTRISGARDDMQQKHFALFRSSQSLDKLHELFLRLKPKRLLEDIPSREHETFEQDLDWLLARLQAVGVDRVVIIDLTQDKFEIPVVRVIIPGLETSPKAPGYTPGPRVKRIMAKAESEL